MRVGVITKQAFSLANFRGPLIREMAARGVEVFALAPDYDRERRAAVAALGAVPVDFRLRPTALSPARDTLDTARLARILRGLRLDATLAYFIKPVIYGSIAARLARVPRRFALIEGAGYALADGAGAKRRLLRATAAGLYRLGLAQTQSVFVLNREDARLFGDGIADPAKIVLLDGIGVDLEHFRAAPPVTEPVTFVMVARLLAEKGVREYVEAARRVKAVRPGARFVLVGGPDANPGALAEDEVRGWADAGLIERAGEVADVRPWLAAASVFVLPSYYREGLPRSTQEAMAMARPVITTDWIGCRETVEEGVNGFLVPPRDVEALAEACLRFVDTPGLVARMGAESRRMAEARFDVCALNERMLRVMGVG